MDAGHAAQHHMEETGLTTACVPSHQVATPLIDTPCLTQLCSLAMKSTTEQILHGWTMYDAGRTTWTRCATEKLGAIHHHVAMILDVRGRGKGHDPRAHESLGHLDLRALQPTGHDQGQGRLIVTVDETKGGAQRRRIGEMGVR